MACCLLKHFQWFSVLQWDEKIAIKDLRIHKL